MPRAGATLVARPALTAQIREALETGAILLEAGAGYGKTAALQAALPANGISPAWVACTKVDRDPVRLLARAATAIDEAIPGSAAVIPERVGTATGAIDAAALTADLLDELDATLVDRVVLVLDDAEALAEAPEAIEVVNLLLNTPIDCLRVAVASRRPLGLRTAKLRAAGRLGVIATGELSFDAEECDALLAAARGRPPQRDEVEQLMAATEGWPLGLTLAVAAHATVAPPAPAAAPAGLADFVGEELLTSIDPDLRRAIEDSSVLSELDADALRALGLPEDLPERAQETGIPLSPTGRRDGSVRHHPLVRDILRERVAARLAPAERTALHVRAAGVARERGRTSEAVELLLDGGSMSEAAAVIADDGPALALTSWRTVGAWIERLPEPERSLPRIKLLAGQVALAGGDQPRGDALLSEVEAALADTDPATTWFARLLRARALHEVGRWDELVAAAEPFDEAAAATGGPPASLVALWAAAVLAATGRIDAGADLAARALDTPLRDLLAPADLSRRLYVGVPAGRLSDAHADCRNVIAGLEHADPLGLLPTATGCLAMVLTYQGDFEAAVGAWEQTSRVVERIGSHRAIAVHAHLARASLLARLGRSSEASQALVHAEPLPDLGFRAAWAHSARAHVEWAGGDRVAALAAAKAALAAVASAPAPGDRTWTVTEVAPVLAAAGDPVRAFVELDGALAHLDGLLPGDSGRYWRACLLAERACLHHENGAHAEADADISALVTQARGSAHHVVRRTWPRIGPAVSSALERDVVGTNALVEALIRARPESDAGVRLLEHPRAAVRVAAASAVAVSGHPQARARLNEIAEDPDPAVAATGARALRRLATHPPRLAVQVLGGFGVTRGDWAVDKSEWRRPVAATLFRYLVVHGSAHRDDVLDAFWPGRPELGARRGLEVAVSLIRGVVDSHGSDATRIEKQGLIYRLRLAPEDRIDATEFSAAARAAMAERDAPRRLILLRAAAALWTGRPLPEDRNSHWATTWREGLEEIHIQVLAQICDEHLRAGNGLEAIEAALRLVDADPQNEAAYRRLMVAHARSGRRGPALRQYLACRRVLVAELGIEPAAETRDLHARILAGETV